MERPYKRPRLHFIGPDSPEPNEELTRARQRNDDLLKSRFESIFERYERDFAGVGDEIGVMSGQIEVDNGHLRSMQSEKDTGGAETEVDSSHFDGRRMLRAMTAAPSDCSEVLPDADDVLQSIETIADSAFANLDSSENDLFNGGTSEAGQDDEESEDDNTDELSKEFYVGQQVPVWSSNQSSPQMSSKTFAYRSTSVDSLFDTQDTYQPDYTANTEVLRRNASTPFTSPPTESTTSPALRARVRRILQEEKAEERQKREEAIELAWRIPVVIDSPPARTSSLNASETTPRKDGHLLQKQPSAEPSTNFEDSVWRVQKRKRRSKREIAADRNRQKIREESEDPLQEGFSSDVEALEPTGFGYAEPMQSVNYSSASERRTRPQGSSTDTREAFGRQFEDDCDNDSDDDSDDGSGNGSAYEIAQPRDMHGGISVKKLSHSTSKQECDPPRKSRSIPRLSAKETAQDVGRHPWRTPTARSGKELTNLAKSIRKKAAQKFVQKPGNSVGENARDENIDPRPQKVPTSQDQSSEHAEDPVIAGLQKQKVLKAWREGSCFYCKSKYNNRHAVGGHWDRILTNFVAQLLDEDDPHDIEFIHGMRINTKRRNRAPSTYIKDFRRMVELHECSSLSFNDIADLRLLKCRKTADKLKEEYAMYRQSRLETEFVWTGGQVKHLTKLLAESTEKTTMYQTYCRLGAIAEMSFIDFGNKVAEVIIDQFPEKADLVDKQIEVAKTRRQLALDERRKHDRRYVRHALVDDPEPEDLDPELDVERRPIRDIFRPWKPPTDLSWNMDNQTQPWKAWEFPVAFWDDASGGFWVEGPHPWNMGMPQMI